MRRRPAALASLSLLLVSLLAACGGAQESDTSTVADRTEADGAVDGRRDAGGTGEAGDDEAYAPGVATEVGAGASADGASPKLVSPGGVEDDATVEPTTRDSSLNAGSVDDNDAWEDFLRYREDVLASGIVVHDVDITNRYVVHVRNDDGRPVMGARVELRDGDEVLATRTTFADGRALLYPPRASGQDATIDYEVVATKGDATASVALDAETRDLTITLAGAPAAAESVPLDVLFLLDTTGSMGDELEQLKANMVSVAEQIDKMSPRPDVRFAVTLYRDRGDEYVTRTTDFTADLSALTETLRGAVANGGGDTPESLNAGLHDALEGASWRGGDALKLVFLVADAAPHLDYSDDADYADDMVRAAELGVKIHPIASSGLEDQGEYVMRQLAQYTTGRFNFLTYGADGVSPGDSTTHHVDDYSVLSLDELVVKLVQDELHALTGAPVSTTTTSQPSQGE